MYGLNALPRGVIPQSTPHIHTLHSVIQVCGLQFLARWYLQQATHIYYMGPLAQQLNLGLNMRSARSMRSATHSFQV